MKRSSRLCSPTRRIAPIIVDANEFAKIRRDDSPLYDNIERGIVLWEAQ